MSRSNDEDACGKGAGHKVELCGDATLCGARRGKRTRAQLANWMCEQEVGLQLLLLLLLLPRPPSILLSVARRPRAPREKMPLTQTPSHGR